MLLKEHFKPTATYLRFTYLFLGIGIFTLLVAIFTLAFSNDEAEHTRFWSVLLHNSVYFLLVANGGMFLICAVSLAMGSWLTALQRVPEAIGAMVPIFGGVAGIVLLSIVLGGEESIYHWLNEEHVAHDRILKWKSGFLNAPFFIVWTLVTLLLWSLLGAKMRQLTAHYVTQSMPFAQGKKRIFTTTVWAGVFMAVFTITAASSIPWLWLLSIDAHWYSSIYSWYVVTSALCATMAVVVLLTVYLKMKGYLPLVNKSHLHDLGKLLFGFSFFWAYLWYAQYMLIWYSDLPEETYYFKIRQQGPYAWLFYLNFILLFLLPFLLLIARDTKRNYYYLIVAAMFVLLGSWLDFYQMIMPGSLGLAYTLSWYEIGTAFLFWGSGMYGVARYLQKKSLLLRYAPFLKESILHHT